MPIDNKQGYIRSDKDELKDQVKQYFINEFGSDINLDDGSNAGSLANILTQVMDTVDELGQGLRDSFLLLKSSGKALDDRGADDSIYRKVATNSNVQLKITGYVNSDIITQITTDQGEFSTADGQVFRITDDVTINSQAKDDNGQPLVDEDGNQLGVAYVNAVSEDTGSNQNVAPDTIINPEQSVDGFYSVTNPAKAQGGLDVESDAKYRQRIFDNRLAKPNGTEDGLTTALRNIADVKDARVIGNRNMTTDSYGNPAKSTHAYVLGGQPNEIAQALLDNSVLDSNFVGNQSGTAVDVAGKSYTIRYDNAPQALIYVKVNVKTIPNEFNSDYGTQQIKDAVNDYFDSLTMGDSVNFTKLFKPIYSVAGIEDADIAMGRDSKDNIKSNNSIEIGDMEVPVVADIDVEVD